MFEELGWDLNFIWHLNSGVIFAPVLGDAKTESRTPSFIHALAHFPIQRACLNVQPLISCARCCRVLHISTYLFFKVIYFCQPLTVPSDLSSPCSGKFRLGLRAFPSLKILLPRQPFLSYYCHNLLLWRAHRVVLLLIWTGDKERRKITLFKPCRRRWNKRLSLPFMSYSRFILLAYSMGNLGPLYSTYFNHEWCTKERRLFTVM